MSKSTPPVPFVLTPDGSTIAAYYTLSQNAVQLDNVPAEVAKKLPRYPLVPTTLIGRLAVGIDFRGQGHGKTLLMDALHRILQHSGEVASAGVIVDAKNGEAVSFYKKYGFLELPDVERRLFLPRVTVAELFRLSTPHSFSRSRMAPFLRTQTVRAQSSAQKSLDKNTIISILV